jgi:hypothetical protein
MRRPSTLHHLVALGQAAEMVDHQTADGVVVSSAKCVAKASLKSSISVVALTR